MATGCVRPAPKKKASPGTVTARPAASLPTTELPWLKLNDHFVATVGEQAGQGSPMGSLLVLADATFAPHSRFPLHPHREMEILSIVIEGELSHHGNQAHDTPVQARAAQLISARNGMRHAEGNVTDHPTRMLQLWFRPNTHGGEAAYFTRSSPTMRPGDRWLVAGDEGMPMRSEAKVWWLDLAAGRPTSLELSPGRAGYLMALDGRLSVADTTLDAGDGAQVRGGDVEVIAAGNTAALWVDLPA